MTTKAEQKVSIGATVTPFIATLHVGFEEVPIAKQYRYGFRGNAGDGDLTPKESPWGSVCWQVQAAEHIRDRYHFVYISFHFYEGMYNDDLTLSALGWPDTLLMISKDGRSYNSYDQDAQAKSFYEFLKTNSGEDVEITITKTINTAEKA
ncbi:MAG: hypothetical protein HRU20_29490 [Pseudomonadales bacterium]|nr:hypothetical protein [Pseudomonadales bacterium]